jgi:hypothetical protein
MSNVNNPKHYQADDPAYETINVIEAWGLGFCLGNAVKYIARAGKKNDAAEDLRKAIWYLERELTNLESDSNKRQDLGIKFTINHT